MTDLWKAVAVTILGTVGLNLLMNLKTVAVIKEAMKWMKAELTDHDGRIKYLERSKRGKP